MPHSLALEILETMPKFIWLIRQKVKEHETSTLTMPQLKVLTCLKDEGLTTSELAEHCGVDITSMSRMANLLVKRGLLLRSVNTKDKRSVTLKLSSDGREVQKMVSVTVSTWVAKSIERMSSAEQKDLSKGMKAMRKMEKIMASGKVPFQQFPCCSKSFKK